MTKRSKLASTLLVKCPTCRDANLFENPNPYNFSHTTKMHRECPNCGQNFVREPGFYFGAAYVSYGLTVGLWIAVFVALKTADAIGVIEFEFFKNASLFFISGLAVLILLFPYIYRLSRSIWLHFFVKSSADSNVES